MSTSFQQELFSCDGLVKHRRCQVCGSALSVTHTHTYVVQRQVWIKIGSTSKPRRRIAELTRPAWKNYIKYPRHMDWNARLHVHSVLNVDIEHDLHQRFADSHVIGEWFADSLPIRQWLLEGQA